MDQIYPKSREALKRLAREAKVIYGFVRTSLDDGMYFKLSKQAVLEMISELASNTAWDECYTFYTTNKALYIN